MKVTGTLLVASAFIVIAFVAAACAPQGMRPEPTVNMRNYTVELKPKVFGPKNELQVKTKAQGYGKDGKKDGYIGFGEDEAGFIILSMKGETPGNRCADASNGGEADWVITLVELSASGDPETEKGTDFGQPQPEWLKEAFPDVDLSTGTVYAASRADAATTVVIDNDNAQEGEQDIYYRATAASCDGSTSVQTDPMVRNRGK